MAGIAKAIASSIATTIAQTLAKLNGPVTAAANGATQIASSSGSVGGVALPANTATTILTTGALAAGQWVISFNCNIVGSAAGTITVTVAAGTGAGGPAGQSTATATLAAGVDVEVSLDFILNVITPGTFVFTGTTSVAGAGTTEAGAATGYTATRVV